MDFLYKDGLLEKEEVEASSDKEMSLRERMIANQAIVQFDLFQKEIRSGRAA